MKIFRAAEQNDLTATNIPIFKYFCKKISKKEKFQKSESIPSWRHKKDSGCNSRRVGLPARVPDLAT